MSLDAMKQALEFIKATNKSSSFWLVPESNLNKTVTALRLAIEQAEKQEPVAFLAKGTRFKMAFFDSEEDGCGNQGTYVTCFEGFEKELAGRWVALVAAEDDCHKSLTTPPQRAFDAGLGKHCKVQPEIKLQRQPLTEEEIAEIYRRSAGYGGDDFQSFARAIERAHGITGETQ